MKSSPPLFVLRAALLLPALALIACAPARGTKQIWPYPEPPVVGQPAPDTRQPAPVGQPVPDPKIEPGTPIDDGGQAVVMRPIPDYPRSAEAISGAAVMSLIKQARAHRDAGRPDQAAAALERAQRIEPRNYFVWSALGQTYLAQKNYTQAESVALKSNVLSRGNVWVELDNWRTIAAARGARGDAVGALQAQARVDELTQWLATATQG